VKPHERIAHDDWADQDLLTREEAAGRLLAEIAEVEAKIAAGHTDEVTKRRLGALKESHANITSAD
jgi:hypothetical protein